MSLNTTAIEQFAAAYGEGEFCAAKPVIQKFITTFKDVVTADESFLKKEEHLIAGALMQAAFDAISAQITCPEAQ